MKNLMNKIVSKAQDTAGRLKDKAIRRQGSALPLPCPASPGKASWIPP